MPSPLRHDSAAATAARLAAFSAAILLAACSGGGDTPSQAQNDDRAVSFNNDSSCQPISGGDSVGSGSASPDCLDCSVSNTAALVDGNFSSFATMTMPAGSNGMISSRATAQDGVVYPIGGSAGVLVRREREGLVANESSTITLYLEGVPVQTSNVDSINTVSNGTRRDEQIRRFSITATAIYDAVEFTHNRTGGLGVTKVFVHEFCAQ